MNFSRDVSVLETLSLLKSIEEDDGIIGIISEFAYQLRERV